MTFYFTRIKSGNRMKKNIKFFLISFLFVTACQQSKSPVTIDLSNNWRFSPDEDNIGILENWYSIHFDDSKWAVIDAGKSWEDQGYPDLDSFGWYRKFVEIPVELKGQDIWLKFGGVNDNCELFINGESVGLFGKSNISVATKLSIMETTNYIKYGEANLIAVRVNDWGNSGGLWRLPVVITTEENVGSITRKFTFEKKYLNFPVKNDAPKRKINLLIDNKIVREFDINLALDEPDFWVYLELEEFKGKEGTLSISELDSKNKKGIDAIYQDNTFPGEGELYKEKHRPQFHYSSKRGWINDPNGMMYYAGEYHLFYQHNPFGWPWGNMTWGHAISKDLVHWEELGDALHPDELGTMYSGSGVVDWNNTTGFQTGDEPPLITIYTNAGDENQLSKGKPYTQGIAYSNDRGRTWTKYEGNPVQGHLNSGNRDPKVIWWEKTNEWVIVLYLKDGRMAFFRSPDLKRWELQSILESFHECPELFQLPVDGNESNKKWVLYGAAGNYFIGDFDGSKFTYEGEEIRYNYGNAFYASQTFSDIPKEDGRRIQIGWAQIATPGMPFNQMMNFPVNLTLHETKDGIRMFANPVREIEKLYKNKHSFNNEKLVPGNNPLSQINGELFDITAEIAIGNAAQIAFEIRGVPVMYNVKDKSISVKTETAPCIPKNGKIKLRLLVDRTSIEIFINDGEYYMPMGSIPDDGDKSLKLFTEGGTAQIVKLDVNELNSAW
jgi:fructan beta-fructosidase